MAQRDFDFDEFLRANFGTQRIDVLGRASDPADMLFKLDEPAYEQQLAGWRQERRQQLLGRDAFSPPVVTRNSQRFGELRKLIGRGRIIPFVGAGAGVACGLPTWRAFLLNCAKEHGSVFEKTIQTRLQRDEYEEAAEDLVTEFRDARFAEAFARSFATDAHDKPAPILEGIRLIAQGCIITTNFDRLIEERLAPSEVFRGRSARYFHRALADGERALLKLHGDIQPGSDRVLTRGEYDEAYGPRSEPDLTRPLPDALVRVFSHFRLLFVGCSLQPDRTMEILRAVVERDGPERFPNHYAIAEAPANLAKLNDRESFLCDRKIFPIWFPAQEYEAIPQLLRELTMES